MAVSEITQSIIDITGISSVSTHSIEDAQRFVASSIPKDLLPFAMDRSSSSNNGSAISIENESIIDVQRNGFSCREIPFSESKWATQTASLKKATDSFPVYWIKNDGVQIAPDTDGSNLGYIFYVNYAEVDDDSDLRSAVVYRASSQEFTKLAAAQVHTWSLTSVPVAPSAPSFGSNLTISETAPVAPSSPSFDIGAFTVASSPPTYTKPVFSAPTLGSVGSLDLPSKPIAPSSPSFTYSDASVSDIVKPLLSISDMATMTESAPVYTKPVVSLTTTPIITDLSITALTPVQPSLSDSTVSFGTAVPNYVAPTLESSTSFSSYTSGLDESDPGVFTIASVAPTSPTIDSDATVSTTSWTAPTFISPVMGSIDYTDTEKWITTEEDSEMLASRVRVIQSQISEYSAKLQESQAKFTKENTEYQAILQKNIQNAQLENSAEGQKLQKYSADLQKYQSDVSKEVQQYTQKLALYQSELAVSSQTWQKEETDKITRYSTKIQDSLNIFNKNNAEYQAQLQISVQNAQLESKDDSQKIQKYSSELNEYQHNINKQVQEYTINEIQKEIAIWNTNIQSDLQSYASNIQNELNSFNKNNVVYQQDVNRKVQNLGKDIQEALKNAENDISVNSANMNKSVQVALQNAVQDFQQDVQEYKAELQKYNSETGLYQAEVNAIIAKWQQEEWVQNFQKYQNDYSQLAQTYQSDIQNELNKFNKEQTVFQNELQELIAEAKNQQTKDSTEYSSKLGKYTAEVNTYQQNIQKEIQDYSNSLQKNSQEYQNKVSLFSAKVQQFQSEIGDKTQEASTKARNAQQYTAEAQKYYEWALSDITIYIRNNSKYINKMIAAQTGTAGQQQQRRRR